jgi:hypothetical protein
MDIRRLWLFSAAIALLVTLGVAVGVSLATGGASQRSAVKPAPVQSACAKKLLADWADGRIDGAYPIVCYRDALKSLPADLQVYSSASDDISQALSQRIVQSANQKISGHQGAASARKRSSARTSASVRSSSTRPARDSSRNVNAPR